MFNLPPGGGTYTLLETISATDAKRTTVQRVLASLPPSLSNGAGTPISKTATSIIGEPSLLGTTDCLMENHSSNGSRISSFTLIAKTSRSQDSRQLEKIRHEYRILRHVHTEYNNRRQPHVKSQQHQDISIGHLTTYNFEKSLHADSNYWQPSRPTLTRSLSRRGFSHPTAETATLAAGDDPTAEDQTFSSVQRKATSKSSDDSPGSSVRQSVGDCPSGENGESESGMDDSFSENSPVRGRPSRVESSTAGSSRRTSVNGLGRINRNSFGGLNGIKIGDASEPHWGHPSIVKPYALLDGKSQNFAAPFGSATGALSVSDTTFFTQSNLGGSNPGIGVGPVLLLYDFGGISLRQYLIERGIRVGPDWITSSSFADRRRGSRDGSARESSNSNSARALPEEHDLYRLSVEDVLSIARQLGHALETVHRANVIHKDINPENIIIRMREDAEETSFFSKLEIQLIDFNLAEIVFDIPTDGRQVDVGKRVLSPTSTLTSTPSINSNNGLHGTLSYMSPEQTGRIQRPVDYRSDFYSLGITLWELFVGKPPFQFDDAMDYVHAHITKEIEPLDSMLSLMPSFLSKVISKLVSKSPDARYQSASGFLSDIDACLQRIAQFRKEHKIPNDQKLSDEQAFLAMNGRFSKVNGSETRRRSLLPSPEDCVDQNSLMASDFEPPRGIRESYCISNEGKDHEDSQATRQASLQSSHLREDFDESDVATSPLPAEPGTKDFARKIVMPKKATFGRAEEVKFLEDILEEACRPYEKMKMVHVIGEAGSGKSHLITKFKAFVTQKNGILVRSKFNNADPNPIAVFQEIISDVMQQLMTKSNETIEQCAAALTKKLSPHDEAVMLQFLPSTALLLKTKPNSIVKSTLTDNERAIIFFFEAISKVLRPMVMCFDNAQIAYENPMTLVHRLMTNSELTNVMVISLVVSSKLTPRAEENLRKFKAVFPGQVFNLIIHPLTEEAVETMLTKSLSPHIGDISSLATLIKFKTLGNPADIIDFLSKATAKSLIQFKDDGEREGWDWDLSTLNEMIECSPNVRERLIRKIQNPPFSRFKALHTAACIGVEVSVDLLRAALSKDNADVEAELDTLVGEGILIPGHFDEEPSDELDATYKFIHSSLPKAVVGTIRDDEKQQIYINLARRLTQISDRNGGIEKSVVTLCHYYSHALKLISDRSECIFVAKMFVLGGKTIWSSTKKRELREQATTLFLKAILLLRAAGKNVEITLSSIDDEVELKEDDAMWKAHDLRPILVNIHLSLAKALDGLCRTKRAVDIVRVTAKKVVFADPYITFLDLAHIPQRLYLFEQAHSWVREAGIDVPGLAEDWQAYYIEEKKELVGQLQSKCMDGSSQSLASEDNAKTQLLLLMAALAAVESNCTAGTALLMKACNHALLHGNSITSSPCVALLLSRFLPPEGLPDFSLFPQLTKLGLSFALSCTTSSPQNAESALRIFGGSTYIMQHDDVLRLLQESKRECSEWHRQILQLPFFTFGWTISTGHPFSWFTNLELQLRLKLHDDTMDEPHYAIVMHQFKSVFTGIEPREHCTEWIVVGDFERLIQQQCRMLWSLLYDRRELHSRIQDLKTNVFVHGSPAILDIHIAEMMATVDRLESLSVSHQNEDSIRLQNVLEHIWSLVVAYTEPEPQPFIYKRYLASAELARAMGGGDTVWLSYEKAAVEARAHGNLLIEALAMERLGELFLIKGTGQRVGRLALMDALRVYKEWGSEGKVRQLLKRYPDLLNESVDALPSGSPNNIAVDDVEVGEMYDEIGEGGKFGLQGSTYSISDVSGGVAASTRSGSSHTHHAKVSDFDLETMLNIAHSIRNEKSLDELLRKVMHGVMKNTGATKGVLVLQDSGHLWAEAIAESTEAGETVKILQRVNLSAASDQKLIPISVVYYVLRSKEPLVLANACDDPLYEDDGYIISNGVKSILACPIVHQSAITGVIYLENNLQPDTFSENRIALIQSLIPSASISIENARLQKTNTELTAALKDNIQVNSSPEYNVDAPVQKAVQIVKDLKARMLSQKDPSAAQMDFILQTLTSADLFTSSIDQINDQHGRGIDVDTKNWIENSLLQRSGKKSVASKKDEGEMFSAAAAAKSVASSSGHATRASSNTTALQLNNALPEDGRSTKNASSESESLSDVTDPDQELLFHRAFDSAKSAEVQLVLTQCEAVDFDVFKLGEVTNGRPLYFLSMHLLRKYGLIEHFRMSENTCANFFRTVESSYRKLSYHNSFHAADVLQTVTLLLLSDADMVSKFTKLEVLAACIASAVHDVDHPGVNNNYLVQSSHPLAIVYNDLSVLEFHHSRKAFEIARRPDCDVFSCLSLDARKDVRRLIIGMVLATDTTSHFTYINKLKSKISASSLNLDDSDDRALVLDMAIKCADLNNPTKTTNQCKNWAYRVMEEFFKQGDKERLMGLPVSKFMDRNDTNIPKCQLGFIDIMVRPLFDAWSQCIRTDFTTTCMANIAKNRAYWESIHNKPEEIPEIPSLSLEELSADPFSSGIRIHQYRLPRFSRDGAEVLVRVGDKKIGDGKAGKLQARKVAGVSAMMGKSLNRRLSMMATTSDGGSRRMSTGRRMTLTPKSPLSRSGSQKDQQTATLTVEPKADGNNLPPLPRVLM